MSAPTTVLRPGHNRNTDCQLDLGIGVTSAGAVAYMLVWPDEDARDSEHEKVGKIIAMVDGYLNAKPGGVVSIGYDYGRGAYIKFDGKNTVYYGQSTARTDGEATVRRAVATVPCCCKRNPAEHTTLWSLGS